MSTYNLVSREEWNARPPEKVTPLNWNVVTQYVIHYSGASRNQSVRSIQDYCMDDKGHSDIDYNYLVKERDLFIGRGDNIGSHDLNQNSISVGVCVIGKDGDATNDDFRVVRELYDAFTAKLGRRLVAVGHKQTQPPGYTDCPGNQIQSWIYAGMPYPSRMVDMFFLQVDGDPAVYVSDGMRTRNMPAGTWETTCLPLINAGVPFLRYPTHGAMTDAGGPLDKSDSGSGTPLPQSIMVTIPPFSVALS